MIVIIQVDSTIECQHNYLWNLQNKRKTKKWKGNADLVKESKEKLGISNSFKEIFFFKLMTLLYNHFKILLV